jgi:hypothetical protein
VLRHASCPEVKSKAGRLSRLSHWFRVRSCGTEGFMKRVGSSAVWTIATRFGYWYDHVEPDEHYFFFDMSFAHPSLARLCRCQSQLSDCGGQCAGPELRLDRAASPIRYGRNPTPPSCSEVRRTNNSNPMEAQLSTIREDWLLRFPDPRNPFQSHNAHIHRVTPNRASCPQPQTKHQI